MEEFVREKIKEKPINKRKLLIKILMAALCGVVFAITACIVAAFLWPRIMPKEPETVVSQSEQKDDNKDDVTETETEASTESTEQETENDREDVPLDYEMTVSDYQHIQNELYAIGSAANKSIVTITSVKSDTDWFNNSYETEGLSAGAIVSDENGEILILTEKKAITKAERISVTFINDVVAEATLKKYDGNTGIAILSVDKSLLEDSTLSAIAVAEIGNSNLLTKGQIVIALGSPLGTSYSILSGSVTSKGNEITTKDNNYSILTTDILGSENGSGILINVNGEIVGLIMQDYSSAGASNTLTAVAISDVSDLLGLLMDGEDIPYLGIYGTTVTDKIAEKYTVPKGVYVKEVIMDSPAMVAGIQSGDVIISVDGEDVSTMSSYSKLLLSLTPGETYTVEVKRQGTSGYSVIKCQVEPDVIK